MHIHISLAEGNEIIPPPLHIAPKTTHTPFKINTTALLTSKPKPKPKGIRAVPGHIGRGIKKSVGKAVDHPVLTTLAILLSGTGIYQYKKRQFNRENQDKWQKSQTEASHTPFEYEPSNQIGHRTEPGPAKILCKENNDSIDELTATMRASRVTEAFEELFTAFKTPVRFAKLGDSHDATVVSAPYLPDVQYFEPQRLKDIHRQSSRTTKLAITGGFIMNQPKQNYFELIALPVARIQYFYCEDDVHAREFARAQLKLKLSSQILGQGLDFVMGEGGRRLEYEAISILPYARSYKIHLPEPPANPDVTYKFNRLHPEETEETEETLESSILKSQFSVTLLSSTISPSDLVVSHKWIDERITLVHTEPSKSLFVVHRDGLADFGKDSGYTRMKHCAVSVIKPVTHSTKSAR